MRFVTVLVLSLAVAATAARDVWAQQNAADNSRFALVIGNAAYPDSEKPLKGAVSDARRMAEELRRDRFDVDLGENLTRSDMQSALDRLYAKIKRGSVALIYFGGYGIQSRRQSYMIPVDAQIWSEADVRRDGFGVDKVLHDLNAKGAKIKIAILNASRRNPYERRFRPVPAGLAPAVTPRNTLIMYSAAPGSALSVATEEKSLFVTELINQMREADLSGEEVFIRTRFRVARESGHEQTPWFSSSLAEKFSFDPDAAGESNPKVAKNKVFETKSAAATLPPAKSEPEAAGFPPAKPKAKKTEFPPAKPKSETAKLATPPAPPKPSESVKIVPDKTVSKDDEAIRELDRKIKDDPDDVVTRYKRGTLHARNGDFMLAVADFDEVIRSRPRNPEVLNNRCWARAMLNQLQLALDDCNAAIRLRPHFADALDSRGMVNLKNGKPKEAKADYDAVLEIKGEQASSLYGRGIAKIRSGNAASGNRDIAAAKSIDPGIAAEFASYGIK